MNNKKRNTPHRMRKKLILAFPLIIGLVIGGKVSVADDSVPIATSDYTIDGNSHFAPTSSQRLPSINNACMGDVASQNGISGLNCTANDIDIAEALDIVILDGPGGDPVPIPPGEEPSCTIGEDVTFTAKFQFELSAQERHDLGVWFATGGQADARNGECLVSTAPIFFNNGLPINDLDGNSTGVCSEDTTQVCSADNDCRGRTNTCTPLQDYCGDIDDFSSPQFFEIEITTECVDKDRDGDLDLPVCLSWRQPGADEYCATAEDAYPGSPSKCNCDDTFSVPIKVPTPPLTVIKSVSPTTITEPGGTVTVTFDIVNPSEFGNDIDISDMIDALDDYVVDGDDEGTGVTVDDADFSSPTDVLTLYDDNSASDVSDLSCLEYPESQTASPNSSGTTFDPSSDLLTAQADGTVDPTVNTPNFVRCTFTRFVGGEQVGPDTGFFFDLITVTGVDESNNVTQGEDDAGLQIVDKPPKVNLAKTVVDPTSASLTEQQVFDGNTNITYKVVISVPNDSDTVTIGCLEDKTNIGTADSGFVGTYTCDAEENFDLLSNESGSPTCKSLSGQSVTPGQSVECQFVAAASGITNTGEVLHDRVVVKVSDDEGGTASASDTAMVTVTNSSPSLKLTKTGAPTVNGVDKEPSYQATYTYVIENITDFDDIVVLDKLEDTITLVDGTTLSAEDITNSCLDTNGKTLLTAQEAPVELEKGESFTCTLSRIVGLDSNGDPAGDAPGKVDSGNTEDNLAKVTGHEKGFSGEITAMDNESLGFKDATPSATVKKDVKTLQVTFKVTVSNTSSEKLDLIALTDNVGGVSVDITLPAFAPPSGSGLNACDVSALDELAEQNVGNTDDYICYFTRDIDASGSDSPIINTVTATAEDDEGNQVNPTAKAQVAWESNYTP